MDRHKSVQLDYNWPQKLAKTLPKLSPVIRTNTWPIPYLLPLSGSSNRAVLSVVVELRVIDRAGLEGKKRRSIKRGRDRFYEIASRPIDPRARGWKGGRGGNLFRGRRRVNYDSERKGWEEHRWKRAPCVGGRVATRVSLMGATEGVERSPRIRRADLRQTEKPRLERVGENFIFPREKFSSLSASGLLVSPILFSRFIGQYSAWIRRVFERNMFCERKNVRSIDKAIENERNDETT